VQRLRIQKEFDWKDFIQVSICALVFFILLNGIVEAGYNIFGAKGHFVELVLLSCVVVGIGTKQFLQFRKIQKGCYPTILIHNDRKVDCMGFYDSGNTLKDPYTGVGVHIISQEVTEKLRISKEKSLLIPYSSMGNENDLMTIVYLDKMIIYRENQRAEQSHLAAGIGGESLFLEKAYDLILNENIW
jgi:stage II sporulation protein GA (sporulation sigma-E factor processing peptidase)